MCPNLAILRHYVYSRNLVLLVEVTCAQAQGHLYYPHDLYRGEATKTEWVGILVYRCISLIPQMPHPLCCQCNAGNLLGYTDLLTLNQSIEIKKEIQTYNHHNIVLSNTLLEELVVRLICKDYYCYTAPRKSCLIFDVLLAIGSLSKVFCTSRYKLSNDLMIISWKGKVVIITCHQIDTHRLLYLFSLCCHFTCFSFNSSSGIVV